MRTHMQAHTHTCKHTRTHRDLIAAVGTTPSCLALSMCKGLAVYPHQCQHVAYMYAAPGGPVCVCVCVCVCVSVRLFRPLPIGYPVTMWGQQQSSLHCWPQSHLICVSTFYGHPDTLEHTQTHRHTWMGTVHRRGHRFYIHAGGCKCAQTWTHQHELTAIHWAKHSCFVQEKPWGEMLQRVRIPPEAKHMFFCCSAEKRTLIN